MCNSVQSMTLQTAVLVQVKAFATSKETFSIHDITRGLRGKTASGEMEIPECKLYTGASNNYDIPHSKIKSVFNEMWQQGLFDNDFTLTRDFNPNGYFVFTPTLVNNVVPTPAPVNTPTKVAPVVNPVVVNPVVVNPVVVKPAVVNNISTANAATSPSLSQITIKDRIFTYLDHCTEIPYNPTIKEVQSAIKRRNTNCNLTCDQLHDLLIDSGYTIDDNTLYASTRHVILHC